jgi:hypothetical protein
MTPAKQALIFTGVEIREVREKYQQERDRE